MRADRTGACVVLLTSLLAATPAAAQDPAVDYDIVYVRWPGSERFVDIPQGEDPYTLAPGADLVLLHPDGSERVLVDCDESAEGPVCSAFDPAVSYDGEWVYYALATDAREDRSESFLYKIRVAGEGPDLHRPIQLTFDDGFDSALYAGNTAAEDDLRSRIGIRDMAPAPLPDGRIVFASNRAALIAFHAHTFRDIANPAVHASIQQIYVMDDHDGSRSSAARSNLHRVDFGNLHAVQHPIVLRDGSLLFSSWQDAATRFTYANTSLFGSHPDGSNLHQITEPHAHHKDIDHFATQLGDGQIVTAVYYPSFDYGFGILARFPYDPGGIPFTRDPSPQTYPGSDTRFSFRSFDRVGWHAITTHTISGDCPAPDDSGKYSMPAAAPDGNLLVAYSSGAVNYFDACGGDASLLSGVYLVRDAGTTDVSDPSQLVRLRDDPWFNEIWPRPVVPYERIHGIERPPVIPDIAATGPQDDRIPRGSPTALLGTSSMWNRESRGSDDPFSPSQSREINDGNWRIQGAEAGVFSDEDLYGVRIVMIVPVPFTHEYDRWGASSSEHRAIVRYLPDGRADRVVQRYASAHQERWEVLGEFPVHHAGMRDPRGDPDSSWLARVPADTPLLIQGIDRNGMTLFSELTWRALRPGEVRADCGGCHAHSTAPVDFAGTAAFRREPLSAPGLAGDDPIIAAGLWDLTGRRPMIEPDGEGEPRVVAHEGGPVDAEFTRDVLPLLQRACLSCHRAGGEAEASGLTFDGTGDDDPYGQLVLAGGHSYPQVSRYVRTPQARQSLLVWAIYGRRLDGRENGDREEDIDFGGHPPVDLTPAERARIARWVDMGSPIDFPGATRFTYTTDDLLPVIHVDSPRRGLNPLSGSTLRFGVLDVESGVDWATLTVRYYREDEGPDHAVDVALGLPAGGPPEGIVEHTLGDLAEDTDYVLVVEVRDGAGNLGRDARRFVRSAREPEPPPRDAGAPLDGGATPGAPGSTCGCRAARADPSAPRSALALLLVLVAVAARRRARATA